MAKTERIAFSYSQNIANNQSTVTVSGIITTTGESWRGDSRTGTYTISKGSTTVKSGSFTHGAPANSTTTLFTESVTVTHADNGTCETITASYNYSDGWSTASGTLSLPTIPRKSTLSVSNGTLGTAQTLTITEKASAFNHKLTYSCGSASGYILGSASATSSTLSTSWTPPLELASQNTSGTAVSITFTLYTYSGSTLIGSNSYTKTFTIPASVAPSCSIAVSDYMGIAGAYGGYVKNKSRLSVVVTPTTSYGASISTYNSSANGTTYTGASFTTEPLKSHGAITISTTVTDKRGRSGSDSETITVLDYNAPIITGLSVLRCNADGVESEQGEYVKATFSASITALSNLNSATYALAYKKTTEDTYTTVALSDLHKNYSVIDYEYTFEASAESSFNVKVTAMDDFETSTMATTVSTARTLIDFYGDRALALGKVCEIDEGLELGFDMCVHDGYDIKAHYGASKQYNLLEKVDELNTNLGSVTTRLGQIGDYARITLSNNYAIKSQNTYEKLPMNNLLVNYGNTFRFNSDGSISVLRDCVVMIIGQPYFGVGFLANDWVCSAIYISNSPVGRAGTTVHHTSPYLTLPANYIGQRSANEWIDLRVLNEAGARGQISISVNTCYLLVVALS